MRPFMTAPLRTFSVFSAVQEQFRRSTMSRLAPTYLFRAMITTDAKQTEQTYKSIEIRPRRALLYVPGSDERKLRSSLSSPADCIIYDLEDSVTLSKKGAARQLIIDALEAAEHSSAEKGVRINAIGSGLELDDLNVVLHSNRLQSIVIPKVQSAKDIQFVSHMIDSVAPESNNSNIRLIASIESAMGLVNIKEIATSDPRLDALIFAAEDYCADLGLIRTESRKELLYVRQAVVTVACAFSLQAIDLVCLDYQNNAILEEECQEGREFGFVGKQAIHPGQIDIIQRSFAPSKKDVERAAKIIQTYDENAAKGIGAYALDGKVIDAPVWKWANLILARARRANMKIPTANEAETGTIAEKEKREG